MARPNSPNEPALAASQPLPSRLIGRRTLLAGGAAAIGGAWVHRAAEALSQISGAGRPACSFRIPLSIQGTPPSAACHGLTGVEGPNNVLVGAEPRGSLLLRV